MPEEFSTESILESLKRISARKKQYATDPFEVLVLALAEQGCHKPIGSLSMHQLNNILMSVLAVAYEQWSCEAHVIPGLVDNYPEDVFAPLTVDEVGTLVAAMTATGIPDASGRLHAQWARKLLRKP